MGRRKGVHSVQEYEIVHEIFNSCSGNQMRDVFITEEAVDDPEAYLKRKFASDPDFSYEINRQGPDGVIFDVLSSGLRQRFSFTPL